MIMFAIILMTGFTNVAYASDINTDQFKDIYSKTGVSDLDNKTGQVIGIVQLAGTGISLIALIILGVRYMLSSPNEKASIKEKLMPYLIGTLIFFAASNIVAIISKFALGI